MTKQEFDIIIEKANLVNEYDSDELFLIVNNALNSLSVLDKYDGDTYEN